MADEPDDKTYVVELDYSRDGQNVECNSEDIGGFNARKLGCLCRLVRHRHTNQYTGESEYGHAIGFQEGGRYYFKAIINRDCPLHGTAAGNPLET